MKNKDLIKKLQEYPDDMEVCIFDYKTNVLHADEEGTSEGVYSNFDVEMVGPPEAKKSFLVLEFENLFLPEEDN